MIYILLILLVDILTMIVISIAIYQRSFLFAFKLVSENLFTVE